MKKILSLALLATFVSCAYARVKEQNIGAARIHSLAAPVFFVYSCGQQTVTSR